MRRFILKTALIFFSGLFLLPQQISAAAPPANCQSYNNGIPVSYEELTVLLNSPTSGIISAYQLVTSGESYPLGANYYTQIDKVLQNNGWKQEQGDTNSWVKYFGDTKRCLEVNRTLGCNHSPKPYNNTVVDSFQVGFIEDVNKGICKQYGLVPNGRPIQPPSQLPTPSSPGMVENIINGIEQLLHIGNQDQTGISQNTNNDRNEVIIPVYPGAKLVPKIGRPVANGWNRLYVLNGDHINEVAQFYQNWLSKTGRSSLIQTPLGTHDLGSGVNNVTCSATRTAFGPAGKTGEEHIYFHLEMVKPGGCTLFLANGQAPGSGQATVMYVYDYAGFIKKYPSTAPSNYNVGANNTVIDIYYTSKQERVNNNSPAPSDNNTPNQKPLYIPSNTQGSSTADDWYKLIPKVSLGYFLDNLGHAFRSLLPFGWGK